MVSSTWAQTVMDCQSESIVFLPLMGPAAGSSVQKSRTQRESTLQSVSEAGGRATLMLSRMAQLALPQVLVGFQRLLPGIVPVPLLASTLVNRSRGLVSLFSQPGRRPVLCGV